jgi:hypothetical protein
MAWSDAARKASAEARRRKAEAEGNFHYHGTPKFDSHYVTNDYRRRLAAKMRHVRHLIHSPRGFSDFHERDKMRETMLEAAKAKGHRIMARSQGMNFGPHAELVKARAENLRLFNEKKKGWSDAARAASLEVRRRKSNVQTLDEKRMKARMRRQARKQDQQELKRLRSFSYQQHDSTGE